MSRIRYIKPEFFTDEDIGHLPPLHRLLFVGLWTEADRLGRLADKPKTLKVKLLPYDSAADIDQMLVDLERAGFIHRYVVADIAVIEIPKFGKHQRPHPKEQDFGFPGPPSPDCRELPSREISRPEIKGPPTIPSSPVGREGNGDGDGKVKGTAAPTLALPAESPALIERLAATWLSKRGHRYSPTFVDEQAGRALLGKGDEAEIERRWSNALDRQRFPVCNGIADLLKHWNAYGAGDAAAPGKPKDIRRGRVAAEDVDWSGQESEVTNEF